MKPKAKTMAERMGFVDGDLSTPEHDAIMLWLDGNADRLAATFVNYSQSYKRTVERARLESKEKLQGYPLYPEGGVEVIRKTWEYCVKDKRDFTVGFVDMLFELDVLARVNWKRQPDDTFIWEWKKPTSGSGHIFQIIVEVKPKIESLGELIRQIRLYESHCSNADFFVCSPDDRFRSSLGDQRIGFIKAEL